MPKWIIPSLVIGLIFASVMVWTILDAAEFGPPTPEEDPLAASIDALNWALSLLCGPALAIVLGLPVGLLATALRKPANFMASIGTGAIAGAIAGTIGNLGIIVGCLIGSQRIDVASRYFDAQIFAASFAEPGIISVLLLIGLGAFGGLLWWVLWRLTGLLEAAAPALPQGRV